MINYFHLGFLLTLVVICNGQFLTPDQLREQYDLGYGARTHYEMSGSRRTDMFNRVNPDYLLRGKVSYNNSISNFFCDNNFYLGFFPFWSVLLIALALGFLLIAIIGLIGYLLGCRRPTAEELYAKEFEQITPDEEFLLGSGGITGPEDSKVAATTTIPINGYFNHDYNQQDFHYDSSPRTERARIGQSNEDMV